MEYRPIAVYKNAPVTCNVCEGAVYLIGDTLLCPECVYADLDPEADYTPRYRFFIRR